MWRVARAGRGPWWFGSSGAGRFDLPPPSGTCYLATDPLAALLEVIGPEREEGAVSADFLAARRLRELRVPRPRFLADLTSRKAAGLGVTLEVHSVVPYDCPQAWARSLQASGADGILYFVRHDPSGARGVALFGKSGERSSWRRGRERSLDSELTRRLQEECGIRIVETPRSNQLRFA